MIRARAPVHTSGAALRPPGRGPRDAEVGSGRVNLPPTSGTLTRDESAENDDRADARKNDEERGVCGLDDEFVARELEGLGRQGVEVEGTQDEGEGELLQDVNEDEESGAEQRAAQQGQVDLPEGAQGRRAEGA
jgi:hypothetical protein